MKYLRCCDLGDVDVRKDEARLDGELQSWTPVEAERARRELAIGGGEWLAGPAGRSQLREMFSHHAGGDPASPLRGSPLRDGTGAMVEAARGRDGAVGEELGVMKNGGAIMISAPKDSGGADSRRQGSARAIQASRSGVAAL